MNQELLEEALKYRREHGYSVIPVRVDKRPAITAWAEFQRRLPTEEEIREMFSKPDVAGIAVVTGKVSGIVVLDTEANADLSLLKEMPKTPMVLSGGGGKHFYFRYPTDGVIPARPRILPEMDLQSDGRYIIVPPSLHQSGQRYEWDFVTSIEEFAEMPEWLINLARSHSSTSGSSQHSPIASVGVPEGQRNTTMTRWIGKLMSRFPEHEWDSHVWLLADGMNQLNKPPLPDLELRGIFKSLARKESAKHVKVNFAPVSVPELLAMIASGGVEWTVEHLFPVGGINLLSGHPGSFKTWVLLHVALSVSRGTPVFGQFATRKTKVLIVDEENRAELIKMRLELLDATAADSDIYISSLTNFKIDDKPCMEKLVAFVEKHDIGLVIFDSFVRVHSKDENTAREIAEVFEGFKVLAKAGITVLMTHHHRKQVKAGKHGLSQNLRGSSDILAAVDTHLAIDYDDEADVLTFVQSKMRVAEAHHPFRIDVTSDTASMLLGYGGEADVKKLKEQEAGEAILELFTQRPVLTREDIVYELQSEVGKTAIGKALKKLVGDKEIQEEKGAKGKKTYTLVEDEKEQE